jgi:hypothetical protein
MKNRFLAALTLLTSTALLCAEPTATDQANSALAKLKDAPNYSWTMEVKIPGLPFEPGVLKGLAEKDGYAQISQELGDWTLDAVFKGPKVAMKVDNHWQAPDPSDGRAMMMAGLIARYGTPVHEMEVLMKSAGNLKGGDDGMLSGDLTEQGAKDALTFHSPGDAQRPPPKNARGTLKIWIKDGALTKFESHVEGMVQFNDDGDPQNFSMTRTLQFKDVGTTKADFPAEAKQKIEGGGSAPKSTGN